MKSFKKILAIILVVILMATSFAACGRRNDDSASDSGDEVTVSPSDEPSEEPVDVTATPEESAAPDEESATPAPEATATDEGATLPDETNASTDEVLGTIDGNSYTNEYFGFSLDLPDGWYIATKEQLAQLMQMTADYLNSNGDTTIDLTKQQIVPLFFGAQSDPTQGSSDNPNIVCLAQNIGLASSMITDVKSFLNLTIQQVAAQGMDMSFGEPEVIDVDGHEVGKVSGTTTQSGQTFSQTMYVFIVGDYVIDFTLTNFTDDEKAALEDVMSTLSFSK